MDRREDFPNYPKDGDDEFADVIAPYDLWHIAVYADCGRTALWDMNGEMLGCAEYGPFESLAAFLIQSAIRPLTVACSVN